MLLTALAEIIALAAAFALGVAMSSTVKAFLGIAEEDVRVQIGLLRDDLTRLAHDLEERLKRLEAGSSE
jgi:hypothetical protein